MEPRISGAVATLTRDNLRELAGLEAFERALGRVSSEDREAYLGATSVSWLPVALVERVLVVLAEESGVPWETLLGEATRRTQERLLHTLYRVLMRITTDEALISRTPTFYGRTYDTGKLASAFPAPGQAIVTLTEWPTISDMQLFGLGVGIETTLRCAGRQQPTVVGKRTREGAVYRCGWKK